MSGRSVAGTPWKPRLAIVRAEEASRSRAAGTTAAPADKGISHPREALLCPACHVHRLNYTFNGAISDHTVFLFNGCVYVFPKL